MDILTNIAEVSICAGGVILGGALASGLVIGIKYNNLVVVRNDIIGQGQVMRNLQEQRETIIDKITKVVADSSDFEKKTLTEVTKYRQQAKNAKQLMAWITEAYPDIKSISLYKELKDELSTTEHSITETKTLLAQRILDYKNLVEQFPNNIIARRFGFKDVNMKAMMTVEGSSIK